MASKINYQKDHKFKFTFVMPVYNVESYLRETIECILSQTLNFEGNCQIIFVNDGSTDNSETVCLEYEKKYPFNIVYIKQENRGVSAARNVGVKSAEGKYISFLDSDDIISTDTLERVYNFFEEHYDSIDVVGIKLEFFEALEGPHPLNFKFDKTRVVDIEEEYSCIQLSGGASFIKTEAIKNKHVFDEQLIVAEDAKLVTEIILEKMAWGAVSEPTYYYRKRYAGGSALNSATKKSDYYTHTLKRVHTYLLDLSQEKLKHVPRYVQYLVMYDLQWRLRQKEEPEALSVIERTQYEEHLRSVLQRVDNDIILEQKTLSSEHKIHALSIKYDEDVMKESKLRNGDVYYRDQCIYRFGKRQRVHLELIHIHGDTLIIEGRFFGLIFKGSSLNFLSGSKKYAVQYQARPAIETFSLGKKIFSGNGFSITVPLRLNSTIAAQLAVGDNTLLLPISTGRLTRVDSSSRSSYRIMDNYILSFPSSTRMFVLAYSRKNHVKKELKRLYDLLTCTHEKRLSLAGFRILYYLSKPFMERNIWLLSDRIDAAGDNAEALFRYLCGIDDKSINPIFTVKRTSSDYDKMKKIGHVIDRDSWYFKLVFLHADKVISSHADDYVINAFREDEQIMRDIYSFDFVFLQHGIIMNDLSKWANRYNKNIKLFVTSAHKERKSILEDTYSYSEKEVILSGLPRYDLLISKPTNTIIIAPTWRWRLAQNLDANNEKVYSKQFKNSEYFKFYNNLLTNRRIREALENHNANIEFYIHPSLSPQVIDFTASERVKIIKPPYDYRSAFEKGNLLVTDYSSVAFDFAYMKKPIIYTQFDEKTFFSEQVYDRGYFSYEKDGLGVVVYNEEETVEEIIRSIRTGYAMDKKYQKRVDEFYAYTDRNNSQRVYKAIKEMNVN